MSGPSPSLASALDAAVGALPEVERVTHGDVVELRRSGRSFARLDPAGAAFRLDPIVASAALRTADTRRSSLGDGWLDFTPATIDTFAVDRARAWLEVAWRRAAPAART